MDSYRNPYGLVLVVLFLGCTLAACSEKNAEAPYYNQVHNQSWLDPNGINTEQFHGHQTYDPQTSGCGICHDLSASDAAPVPGCLQCHFDINGSRVPSGSQWSHGRDGHETFQDDLPVCNACHDVHRRFDTGLTICHDCHGSGEEHVLGRPWLDRESTEFHGDQPQQDCDVCHSLATDCSQCHFGPDGSKSPGGSGRSHGPNDDHEELERYGSTCNRCHFLSRSYRGQPDSSCHDCHDD